MRQKGAPRGPKEPQNHDSEGPKKGQKWPEKAMCIFPHKTQGF